MCDAKTCIAGMRQGRRFRGDQSRFHRLLGVGRDLLESPSVSRRRDRPPKTEKRKYAKRGSNWCSEFASFVYRSNDLLTPDPNKGDVHFKNMADFFRSKGHVYPMREVVSWSDAEKQSKIKPGSFVSILIGDSTHSLIFTTWVRPERGEKITKYTAVSGNNKGMVWPHDPLILPSQKDLEPLSDEKLAEYDQKVYFAVPGD